MGPLEQLGAPGEDAGERGAQLVGDVGEQVGAQPVGGLQHADLLLGLGQPDRHRGRLRLLPLQPLQVGVAAAQLRGQPLRLHLSVPAAGAHPAGRPGDGGEDHQGDQVAGVGDGQGVQGGTKK